MGRLRMAVMIDETAQRLDRLEAHVAHLERQVEQLNEVLIAQDKLVERLKKQVQGQSTTLGSIERDRIKATDARPPHY